MKITSTSNRLVEDRPNQIYTIEYGSIKTGTDTRLEILFEDATYLKYGKSCQCTAPSVEILDNGFKLIIHYDNKKMGTINQYVDAFVKDGEEQKKVRFNLKGQIF